MDCHLRRVSPFLSAWLSSALLAALLAVPAVAQEVDEWADAPPPPERPEDAEVPAPLPPVIDEGARELRDLEEADVIIVHRDGETRREYRSGGRLIMVEVTPAVGPSYYLIDTTGDGTLDARRDELGPDFVPPSWVIFQW